MVYNLAVSLSRGVFTYTLTNTLFHQVIIVRKRPPLSFPQLLICISLLCALTGALTLVASHTSPDRRFEQFTSQLFQEEMTGSTLNMHYTIADPKTFGISEYEPVLPIYHSGQPEDSQEHCSDLLHRLDRIDPDRLSPENAYTYRLLHCSLENDLALADFPYYNEPLSPSSGMQSQLPVLLAEYTFRTKRDVTDYLALLDQIDDYFASLLLYEQEKAAAGFFMPACSSEKVRKQCDTIVTTEELAQGTHFLQTTFEDRLSELQKQGLFTPEETASLIETNEHLLATVVQPAYAALSEGLLSLETSTNADSTASETTANAASGENNSAHNGLPKGLALLPDGKTYYLHLLFSETGSSSSEKELVQMLLVQFQKEQSAIRNLASQSPSLITLLSEENTAVFPLAEPEEMLSNLQARMKNDFPVSSPVPTVTVKDVVPSLEPYSAPAFYLTTPLGDSDNNVIYINRRNSPQGLELYTTLAHEGFPGHLYQTVTFQRQKSSNIRNLLCTSGFAEGWATYIEPYAYQYAADYIQDPSATELARISWLNRSINLCMYSLLDIEIHYNGWTQAEAASFLKAFGIEDSAVVSEIYQYILETPGNYLKYYWGYLSLLDLRTSEQNRLGQDFDLKAFHSQVLKIGGVQFPVLEKYIDAEF